MTATFSLAAEPLHAPRSADARSLKRALLAGIGQVVARREYLDRINVFPVPDGDTGSNLASTLGAVRDAVTDLRGRGAGGLLQAVAHAAVDGARGNSGAILAQFLCGASQALQGSERLSAGALAAALHEGAEQARGAVADPREGTILSVIGAFARAFAQQIEPSRDDLRGAFERALVTAREALADTPRQLPVLRRAGVVDAGAQGFVDLLDGINAYLRDGRRALGMPTAATGTPTPTAVATVAHDDTGPGRWCVECLLSHVVLDRSALRAALAPLGGSCLVIAGDARRLRVHLHLDEPSAFFETLAQFGAVSEPKADDMHAQQHSVRTSRRVAVITDSAADLPAARLAAAGVAWVPVRVIVDGVDHLDKIGLSVGELYRRMRDLRAVPRTSQPPAGDFSRRFQHALSHHDEAVYVGLSAALSGTCQAAQAASRGQRVVNVDSRNVACGLGLLAETAGHWAEQGLDAAAIAARLIALVPRVRTFGVLRDLTYAVRGGRVPRAALPLTRWLKLAPVLASRTDGRLHLGGALRAGDGLPVRFAAWLARRVPRADAARVLVGHCDNPREATQLAATLAVCFGLATEPDVVESGAAIGAHAGPGTLVVGFAPALD